MKIFRREKVRQPTTDISPPKIELSVNALTSLEQDKIIDKTSLVLRLSKHLKKMRDSFIEYLLEGTDKDIANQQQGLQAFIADLETILFCVENLPNEIVENHLPVLSEYSSMIRDLIEDLKREQANGADSSKGGIDNRSEAIVTVAKVLLQEIPTLENFLSELQTELDKYYQTQAKKLLVTNIDETLSLSEVNDASVVELVGNFFRAFQFVADRLSQEEREEFVELLNNKELDELICSLDDIYQSANMLAEEFESFLEDQENEDSFLKTQKWFLLNLFKNAIGLKENGEFKLVHHDNGLSFISELIFSHASEKDKISYKQFNSRVEAVFTQIDIFMEQFPIIDKLPDLITVVPTLTFLRDGLIKALKEGSLPNNNWTKDNARMLNLLRIISNPLKIHYQTESYLSNAQILAQQPINQVVSPQEEAEPDYPLETAAD